MMEITNAGAEALLAAKKLQAMANRIEDLEGEILYLKGSLGQWTKEPPSKPGWYWICEQFAAPEIAEVFVYGEDEKIESILRVNVTGETAVLKLSEIKLWWSIPIAEPPKPEEPK